MEIKLSFQSQQKNHVNKKNTNTNTKQDIVNVCLSLLSIAFVFVVKIEDDATQPETFEIPTKTESIQEKEPKQELKQETKQQEPKQEENSKKRKLEDEETEKHDNTTTSNNSTTTTTTTTSNTNESTPMPPAKKAKVKHFYLFVFISFKDVFNFNILFTDGSII